MTNPTMLCRTLAALAATSALLSAQRGLREIPDPSVQAQLDGFTVAAGARITLFAAEPLIQKPIHMNWDGEGRLWVVGSSTYPHIEPGQAEADRVYVVEDVDGDGKADKSTVFADDLHIPTAVLPGDGGVYVINSTELLFLQDTDGDGEADRRTVVLSGFGTEDTHHLVHTLRWGPAGQMWFNQSIYIHSHVETPHGVRRMLGGGMWHFRTDTHELEPFMLGLVNPWGHVFDECGQSFMTDGAGGQGINFVFPRSVFATSPGASRILRGLNPGQPKQCGLEVTSGRHVPEEWNGVLLAPDFRGNRINAFRLSDNGTSAFASTQVDDLLQSSHRAFRPVDVKMGPDGAIYVADWYNPIIQHGEVDFRDERRDHQHGRVWRIDFPGRPLVARPAITTANVEQLASLIHAPEGWTREQAMVELRRRSPEAAEKALAATTGALPEGADPELEELRRMWALQAIDRFDPAMAERLSRTEGSERAPAIRAAALRALYYRATRHAEARTVAVRAIADPNPRVRLWGVSVLAQLPDADTVPLAVQALDGIEAPDDFLDFAVWSICREHRARWAPLLGEAGLFQTPQQLLFAVRAAQEPAGVGAVMAALQAGAFAESDWAKAADVAARVGREEHLEALFALALDSSRPAKDREICLGALQEAMRLRGAKPAGGTERLLALLDEGSGSTFGRAAALAGAWKIEAARAVLESRFQEDDGSASACLDGLIALGGRRTAAFLRELAADRSVAPRVRQRAAIGCIRVAPEVGAAAALDVLGDLTDDAMTAEVFDAVLAQEKAGGRFATLVGALAPGSLPRTIGVVGAQRISTAPKKPEGLAQALERATDALPIPAVLAGEDLARFVVAVGERGDPTRGEAIYRRPELQCQVCHAIGGSGGVVGPDLLSIGASAPTDYLVESLLEPSKKIKEGYHTALLTTRDGTSHVGAIVRESGDEIVLRDPAGQERRLARRDVTSRTMSPVSLMPAGLTAGLRGDELADLVRFLSELGRDGPFRVPQNRYVRAFELLEPNERTRDALGHYGPSYLAMDRAEDVFRKAWARVDGSLPFDEVPEVVGRGRDRFHVARTDLQVERAGSIPLRIEGDLRRIQLFLDAQQIVLPEDGTSARVEVELAAGSHHLTVVGMPGIPPGSSVRIEVLAPAEQVTSGGR
jgi:putative heme-binding domain-containing protein